MRGLEFLFYPFDEFLRRIAFAAVVLPGRTRAIKFFTAYTRLTQWFAENGPIFSPRSQHSWQEKCNLSPVAAGGELPEWIKFCNFNNAPPSRCCHKKERRLIIVFKVECRARFIISYHRMRAVSSGEKSMSRFIYYITRPFLQHKYAGRVEQMIRKNKFFTPQATAEPSIKRAGH